MVLGVRFMTDASLPTLFLLSGVVTVGAWWMANVGIPWWNQAATLFGSLNSIGATVREVHPPYLGSGLQGWLSTSVYRPTDLILLDIVPVGHADPILSVDEVDLGTAGLRPGQGVTAEVFGGGSEALAGAGCDAEFCLEERVGEYVAGGVGDFWDYEVVATDSRAAGAADEFVECGSGSGGGRRKAEAGERSVHHHTGGLKFIQSLLYG